MGRWFPRKSGTHLDGIPNVFLRLALQDTLCDRTDNLVYILLQRKRLDVL